MDYLGFSICKIMLSANGDNFTSSFLILVPTLSPFVKVLFILERRGERGGGERERNINE